VGDRGWAVISGAAFGIDAAAHRGSLASSGLTAAVLACGVDTAYPAAHSSLLARIAERGTLVSEVPPGTPPMRRRFLTRNRVIAALSRGTVVVEAAVRSGSLRTAAEAEALLRPVMGIPGPITSSVSAGVHQWIASRRAELIASVDDLLAIVGDLDAFAPSVSESAGSESTLQMLGERERKVLAALSHQRFLGIERIAAALSMAVPQLLTSLGLLHALGRVERRDQSWRAVG
jgi:DNA processing protein